MKKPDKINGVAAGPLMELWRAWNRFWFSPADPTVLGLVRICAGMLVFYIHLCYTYDLQNLMGPQGWVSLKAIDDYRHEAPWLTRSHDWYEQPTPEQMRKWHNANPEGSPGRAYFNQWHHYPQRVYARGYPAWSIWFAVTDPRWITAVHYGVLVIMALFTIGFCTRVTSVLTWLAAISYIQRSPISLFGMDTITNLLLLYLMIGPSGAALSVDRLIQRYWTTYRGLRKQGRSNAQALSLALGATDNRPAPLISANLALRLIQVHVCIIYFISGTSKLQGNAWWNGTAVWGTVANPEFSPIHFPLYLAILKRICSSRWLWETVMSVSAVFTLAFEIGFAALIWNRPLRWVMIAGAVGLHTGIAVFMGLTQFSLAMLTMVIAFVPPETLHRLLEKLGRGPDSFTLAFNRTDRRQVRLASLIRAFDPWEQIHWSDKSSHSNRMQLIAPTGEMFLGYSLFEKVTTSLRLLWPLAPITWIPGVDKLITRLFSGPEKSPTLPAGEMTAGTKSLSEKVRS